MGGKGSGRKPDPVNLFRASDNPDADAGRIFLPNLSGVKQEAKTTSSVDITAGGTPETDPKFFELSGAFWAGANAGTIDITNLPVNGAGTQYTTNEAETAMELQLASKYLEGRKGSPGTINAGDAVYISGWNAGQSVVQIELADASSSATMPAVGLAFEEITQSSNGRIIMFGNAVGIVDTSSWSEGDAVYVSETAGELTNTKPITSGVEVQNMGTIGRSHATLGQLTIVGAGRTNDVPNDIEVTGSISGGSLHVLNRNVVDDLDSVSGSYQITSGAYIAHAADSSDPHGATLTQTNITLSSSSGAGLMRTDSSGVVTGGHIDPTGGSSTKELFIHAYESDTTPNTYGAFMSAPLSTTAQTSFRFKVPHDFTSLIAAECIVVCDDTETLQWDVNTTSGQAGEAFDVNSGAALNISKSVTANTIENLECSGAMSGGAALAADDYYGVLFQSDTTNIHPIGFRLRYA